MPPDVRQAVAAARDAHCQYCGGQPCGGGIDNFALITGVQKSQYMCAPCWTEYYRFFQQQLSPDTSVGSPQEQVAAIQKQLGEADAHMRQWALERGSR